MRKANTQTKCANYNKCKYTGTCSVSSNSYQWLTTSNSDVKSNGCWYGVNF